jgi:hypothetical protein
MSKAFRQQHQYGLTGVEYRRAYRSGRKMYYNHSLDDSPFPLDTPKEWAWEDGFLDEAAGREQFHLRDCKAHHNESGGCGVA